MLLSRPVARQAHALTGEGGWMGEGGAQGRGGLATAHAGPAPERGAELEVASRASWQLSLTSVLDGREPRPLGTCL